MFFTEISDVELVDTTIEQNTATQGGKCIIVVTSIFSCDFLSWPHKASLMFSLFLQRWNLHDYWYSNPAQRF